MFLPKDRLDRSKFIKTDINDLRQKHQENEAVGLWGKYEKDYINKRQKNMKLMQVIFLYNSIEYGDPYWIHTNKMVNNVQLCGINQVTWDKNSPSINNKAANKFNEENPGVSRPGTQWRNHIWFKIPGKNEYIHFNYLIYEFIINKMKKI